MKIYSIGFTKTSAEGFFTRLMKSGAKKLVDVRLNNISQLAGSTVLLVLIQDILSWCQFGYMAHSPGRRLAL